VTDFIRRGTQKILPFGSSDRLSKEILGLEISGISMPPAGWSRQTLFFNIKCDKQKAFTGKRRYWAARTGGVD
jgi:hypothetical protein